MRRTVRGFTLIEVLLATVLLAAGLALAFATLRSSTTLVQRGEAKAMDNERMRAVQGFLRQHLGNALPIVFATDPVTYQQSRFIGEPTRMRFVADLPAYLGRGGPYLYDLRVDDAGVLSVGFAMVQAGQRVEDPAMPAAEPLARGLGEVHFRYRGLDEDNQLGDWQDEWTKIDVLPLQVAIRIEEPANRPWPELIVTLRQSEGGVGGSIGGQP